MRATPDFDFALPESALMIREAAEPELLEKGILMREKDLAVA